MLHKLFEGCGHLWTWIHNCGFAASLSIGPTVRQTSENGGDAECCLCNYDFISRRWWAECIYELKNAFGWLILHLPRNKNACWEMSTGMNWNEHAGDDELDGLLVGFWCLDNLPLARSAICKHWPFSLALNHYCHKEKKRLDVYHENKAWWKISYSSLWWKRAA